MNLNNGRIWPVAIGVSIILVFFAAIATILVAVKLPVEKSDTYMMYYQEADANANKLIQARIDFDKEYTFKHSLVELSLDNSTIEYKMLDIKLNPVNNAKVKIIVTRPNNHKNDQEFLNPKVENGVYRFESIKLPLEGRWDIMAKVTVDDVERFYNIKADTRNREIKEY